MVYQIFFLQSIRTFVCSRDLRKHRKNLEWSIFTCVRTELFDLIICIQDLGKEFFKMLNSAIQFRLFWSLLKMTCSPVRIYFIAVYTCIYNKISSII